MATPSDRVRSRYQSSASDSRLGSRHRNSFRVSRAVRSIASTYAPGFSNLAAQRPYRPDRFGIPMAYPPPVRALLDRAQADGGDTAVVRAKGSRHEGTRSPHQRFTGEDIA